MAKRELIDRARLLSEKMKSKYYHLTNGDIAIPIIDIEHSPIITEQEIVKPYLEELKTEIENLEQGITSYHNDRPWVFTDEVISFINNLLSEQEG